jgi:hypothetical protein
VPIGLQEDDMFMKSIAWMKLDVDDNEFHERKS